jgi:hypothetical protein
MKGKSLWCQWSDKCPKMADSRSPFCYFHTKMAFGLARPYQTPTPEARSLFAQIDWDPFSGEPWSEDECDSA